jgi:hypothetical protein
LGFFSKYECWITDLIKPLLNNLMVFLKTQQGFDEDLITKIKMK